MLHEYAIEPSALTRFETCRYILEKMGIPKGRYIANFPSDWLNSVRQACSDDPDCLGINRQKIMISLKKASKCVLNKNYRFYDRDLEWLQNAENGHAEAPFYAIIAKENPRSHTKVLEIDNITEEHPLLAIQREKIVIRTATELLKVAMPLLEVSNEFIFVDGYFNPLDKKYQNTTKAFLRAINKVETAVKRLEYHTRGDRKNDGLSTFEDFCKACLKNFSGCPPKRTPLRFFRWNQRTDGIKLHARYLLTNVGGIRFDAGLDEAYDAGNGKTNQDTDVSLIDTTVYNELWNRFTNPSQYFDRSDQTGIEVL